MTEADLARILTAAVGSIILLVLLAALMISHDGRDD